MTLLELCLIIVTIVVYAVWVTFLVTFLLKAFAREVVERSKVNEAVEEIEFLRQHRAEFITEDGKVCIDSGEVLEILKRVMVGGK